MDVTRVREPWKNERERAKQTVESQGWATSRPQAALSADSAGVEGGSARLGLDLRRGLDVLGATVLLVVASPLLAVGAAAVWVVSGRPILFGHRRVGKGGRPFRCWKLRTMEPGAEERLERDRELKRRYVENGFKLPHDQDPRVLAGTGWLRRSHVDELPQLLNVIRGDMSLVGPRPLVEEELGLYGEERDLLLSRRPGLAGAWTARRDRPPYPERARLELEYVRNGGLGTDVGILVRTALAVVGRWVGA